MASRLLVFLLIVLFTKSFAIDVAPQLVVWNVGQGQWVTLIDDKGCWHFDVGGEFAPWGEIMKLCRAENNFVSLSHWDWDHVSFMGRARFYLPNICLMLPPQGRGSARKENLLRGMDSCAKREEKIPFPFWNGSVLKTANASSRVILWRKILLPGDSGRDQEKFWVNDLAGVESTRILILGHHGSATSTGKDLLLRLQNVKVAVASARFRRYGHPHKRVSEDLLRIKVPLLRTEDWGSIRFGL